VTEIDEDAVAALGADLFGAPTNAAGEPLTPPVPGDPVEVVEFRDLVAVHRDLGHRLTSGQLHPRTLFVLPAWAKRHTTPSLLSRGWPGCDVEIHGDRRYSAEELAKLERWPS